MASGESYYQQMEKYAETLFNITTGARSTFQWQYGQGPQNRQNLLNVLSGQLNSEGDYCIVQEQGTSTIVVQDDDPAFCFVVTGGTAGGANIYPKVPKETILQYLNDPSLGATMAEERTTQALQTIDRGALPGHQLDASFDGIFSRVTIDTGSPHPNLYLARARAAKLRSQFE